ncbi:MAG: hypothetical protein WCJ30_03000, partial [Deltaproteobacteria bacterium]
MKPGDLIADRFEVERLAGWGGMAGVYRSLDRFTGETVALKILHGDDERDAARFASEANVPYWPTWPKPPKTFGTKL